VSKTSSATWTWARDIEFLILEKICGSPQLCGPWLVEQITANRVRSRSENKAPDDFWQGDPSSIEIDFKNCTATKWAIHPTEAVPYPIILFGLRVVREDIGNLIAAAELHQVGDVSSVLAKKNWRGPTLQKALKSALEVIAEDCSNERLGFEAVFARLKGGDSWPWPDKLKGKGPWPDLPRDVARDALNDYASQLKGRRGYKVSNRGSKSRK
jgi:hypothetical protein